MSRFDTYHDTELTIEYYCSKIYDKRLTKNVLLIKNAKFDITL